MTARTGEPEAAAAPRISVVVCTHNRAEKLANCLARLGDQTLDRSSYEVVVVDDCSTDVTREVAERYATRVIRNERNLGLAASRNVGTAAAIAPIVAFTDDDCLPDRDWLREMLHAFDDPNVLAVGGKVVPFRADRLLLRYYEANNPLAHNPHRPVRGNGLLERLGAYLRDSFRLHSPAESVQSLFMITGANMGLRRSTFELVGGFDDNFRLGAEDTDFCLRLNTIRPDALIRYSPEAVVAHDFDPSFGDALRRSRAYGRAAAFAYLAGRRRAPSIFPFPFLILVSFGLAAIDLRLLVVPFALLVSLYPGWLRLAVKRRNPAYVGFAPLQAVFEFQTTVGSFGYLVGKRQLRSRRR
jgi:GT2 family glycosyltransferase